MVSLLLNEGKPWYSSSSWISSWISSWFRFVFNVVATLIAFRAWHCRDWESSFGNFWWELFVKGMQAISHGGSQALLESYRSYCPDWATIQSHPQLLNV